MRPKKHKHFSLHIGTHLFAVFTLFAVALLVGYSAKASDINLRALLAATLTGTDATALTVPEVTFAVTPSTLPTCDSGTPRTPVMFSVSDPLGGGFILSLSTTSGGTSVLPGEHFLPNGTYHWYGVVKSGYVGSGPLFGDFVLNNTCPVITTNTSTLTTTGTTANPILNTTFLPEVWYAGSRIASGSTISGEPIIKIYAPGALHASFEISAVSTASKLFTEQNGVLRVAGTNVWSIDPTSLDIPDGIYGVVAFFETSSGKYYTQKVSFNMNRIQSGASLTSTPITQPVPVQQLVTVPTVTQTAISPTTITTTPASPAPRPVLNVFVDNTPVTDRQHAFSNGEVELRIVAPAAKRITLLAASSSVFEVGRAVKDDLLSTNDHDVWSFVWNVEAVPAAEYKVFARVLSIDNHLSETAPVLMSIVHEPEVKQVTDIDHVSPDGTTTNDVANTALREEILSRVTAPSLCVNKEECQVYCASHPEEREHCTTFARMVLLRSAQSLPSLTDGIDPLRIQTILDSQKRSKEIPAEVSNPEKLKDFCAELSHADICAKVLIRNDLASASTLDAKKELVTQVKNEERRIFAERIGVRSFVDSDLDGITDYDEVNIYHTDPNDQDTDHDGFPDGAEIIAHTNPLGGQKVPSSGTSTVLRDEFVKLENPRISGAVLPELLVVESVSLAQDSVPVKNESASSSRLAFKGHATPNSFVTLYIFSEPIVVTVKTDEFGAWTYTFDKALSDGSHEIYSTITDSGGHILAKSEPLPFVKTASAVAFGSEALLPANAEPGFFSGASLYAFIAIIIGILGIAFSVIGFIVRRRDMENISAE